MSLVAFAGKAAGYLVSSQALDGQSTAEGICRADFGRAAPDAVALGEKVKRARQDIARFRNEFAAALADQVFVVYAAPGGKIERFCKKVLGWGKPLLTFNSPDNASLIVSGARPYTGLEGLSPKAVRNYQTICPWQGSPLFYPPHPDPLPPRERLFGGLNLLMNLASLELRRQSLQSSR